MNRIPLFLLGALALALPLHAQVPADVPEGEVHIYKTSAGEPQEMQVYLPPNHDPMTSAKVPGILFFHGGGWTGGNLTQFQRASYYFASRGLVCATANYRMLSREEVKAQEVKDAHKAVCVTDAKSAIRWFKSQADTFGLDPDRIVVGGGSAGGHVAVLSTLNPDLNDPKDPDDEDVTVVAYLLFNPAFATGPVSPEVDPLLHLKNGLAPAIVFFGTEDTRWLAGWDLVTAKLDELGNTTTQTWMAGGQKHSFFNRGPWADVCLRAADEFLIQQGILQGEPTMPRPASGEALFLAEKTN